jgi:hypothetical protein
MRTRRVSGPVVFAVLAVSAMLIGVTPASASSALTCTGSHTGTFSNVIVSAGGRCDLNSATVEGDVIVQPGGALRASDSTIAGSIYASDATVQLIRSSAGNVNALRPVRFPVTATSFLIRVFVCGSTIRGSVSVSDGASPGGIAIGGDPCRNFGGGNAIAGTLVDRNNATTTDSFHIVSDNHAGAIYCSGNSPAPTGSGNVASVKAGQCLSL